MKQDVMLKDILNLGDPAEYKIHFAKWDNHDHPLDVFIRSMSEWEEWNTYSGGRNNFNRKYIFSLIDFYHEADTWMFGGIWEVLSFDESKVKSNPYKIKMVEKYEPFVGRLKIIYPYRKRSTRVCMEDHYGQMIIKEILPECYHEL